ncbi:MAG: MFS transporter [Candidatus Thermoplasmatota archaeon]|jgi:putative MFS transporter|nr:MFS transporter [Candidatus Thermoplasmatota archaeon]
MVEHDSKTENIAGRLERLPFSRFHVKFALMLTSGEWAESLMLLGNGAILGLVAATFGLTGNLSIYALPAFFFIGEFLGSIFFGRLADTRGRKAVFLYNQLIFGMGMIIAGFMMDWQLVAIFVLIGGIGVGGEFPLVDSYGTEVFTGKHRGAWLALIYTIAVTAAPLIIYITSLTANAGYYSFRIPLWFMGSAGIAVWIIRFRLKESPRWLANHGKMKEAEGMMDDIEEEVKKETGNKELPPISDNLEVPVQVSRYKDIFAKDVRKTTIMMAIFMFFQSGIFYGFVIFAPNLVKIAYPKSDPLGGAAVIFSGFVVGSIFNIFIIDRIERKWGIILFAVLGGVFGTFFAVIHGFDQVVIFGFLTAFMLWNFSNFMHQYNAEIFPTRVRTTAAGFVYSISRISTTILVLFIVLFIGAHNAPGIFAFVWILVIIVSLVLIVLGPKSTRRYVEQIAN